MIKNLTLAKAYKIQFLTIKKKYLFFLLKKKGYKPINRNFFVPYFLVYLQIYIFDTKKTDFNGFRKKI